MNINANPIELKKFNDLSDEWWNPHGKLRTLHDINPLRLQFITDQIDLTDKEILDVGCGGGILTEALSQKGAIMSGIDAGDETISIAKHHAQENNLNIQYHLSTIEEFAKNHPHQKYDAIVCMELLEHVDDPKSVFDACISLLKPEGWFFLSTINRTPKAFTQAIVGAEYLLKLLPKGTHHYSKFLKPSELTQWAREKNLVIKELQGMTYHPLAEQYSLTQDPSVNYLISFQKESS